MMMFSLDLDFHENPILVLRYISSTSYKYYLLLAAVSTTQVLNHWPSSDAQLFASLFRLDCFSYNHGRELDSRTLDQKSN